MNNKSHKSTGSAMVLGSLLITITMILHPSGGSILKIIETAQHITIVHALAIFSLPIILFGFYGLTIHLQDKWQLSKLAFIIISIGTIAAMFAALFNGLSLPYFLSKNFDNLKDHKETIELITSFSFAVNVALDYIFISACCLSILIYSVVIIIESIFSKWLGYFGIALFFTALAGSMSGFIFTSLFGFRIFTFSLALWIVFSGYLLMKKKTIQP